MATIGITDAGSTRQALVSSIVQEVLAEKAQLLPLVTDYSASAVPGAASLGIPRRDLFAAAEVSEDASLTGQAMTFSVDTISFAHYAVRAEISDMARVQSSVDIPSEVVKEIGEAMARQADALILAQLKLASSSAPDHLINFTDSVNYDIELADVTGVKRLLRENGKVMMNDDQLFGLISPKQEEYLLNNGNIIDASKYGSDVVINSGKLAKIYGFNVVVSDLLTDNEAIFFHKSAVGFAAQQSFKLEFDRDLTKLNDVYVGSGIMGAKVLQAGKRNVFLSSAH